MNPWESDWFKEIMFVPMTVTVPEPPKGFDPLSIFIMNRNFAPVVMEPRYLMIRQSREELLREVEELIAEIEGECVIREYWRDFGGEA